MKKRKFEIEGIPAVEWGAKKEHVYIAVHGNMSNKEDTIIKLLAEIAVEKNCQVLSFDLPQHGERKKIGIPCKVQFCVKDLKIIMLYAKQHWKNISLFACSMGAYFSLLAYKEEALKQCIFLSPVVDMEHIISNMMMLFKVTPERLEKEQEIETPIGQILYWDYYCYVKEHPVDTWNVPTGVLYGAKDDLCEFEIINNFVKKFRCQLEVMQQGEHFFYTNEQLNVFQNWLKNIMIM